VSQPHAILPLEETVSPASADELAEVVRGGRDAKTPLYPIGGGTTLDFGPIPRRPGLGVSLAGLNRIVDHPADDLTVTVEPGLTVAALNRHLARHNQRLPIDVAQPDRATVGGIVATDASGPRRMRMGTLRDYVIGLTAVDGTGVAFSSGGRVVKNAAGYDLARLLIGSLGTLGVVSRVTLMVKPLPETSAWVAVDLPDFEAAETLLADLVAAPTLPAAIELVTGPAFDRGGFLARQSASSAARLAVGFEGTGREVEWMLSHLVKRWQAMRTAAPTLVDDAAGAAEIWGRLAEFSRPEAADGDAGRLVAEVAVPPSKLTAACQLLLEIDPHASLGAHAGDGIVVARFSVSPAETAALVGRVRRAVAVLGAKVVVLGHCPRAALDGEAVWGPPSPAIKVMETIKHQFDPAGILNPGRYVY